MTGIDIAIEEFGITLLQPTLKQIAMLGEQNYFIALQLLTITKESLQLTTPNITNWDIFQEAIKQKISGIANNRVLISNFLKLFFKENVNLGPRSIMIIKKEEILNIEQEDFDFLQYLIATVGGKSLLRSDERQFNAKSKRAQEIAEKMKKAHARLEKVKALERGIKPQEMNKGFLSRYIKIVATKTANSINEVTSMTLYQIDNLVKSYNAWEAYDLDVRSRLAGAKNDKELVHWSIEDQTDSK